MHRSRVRTTLELSLQPGMSRFVGTASNEVASINVGGGFGDDSVEMSVSRAKRFRLIR